MINEIPLELIDFIYEKINRTKLVEICNEKYFIYTFNENRIKKYWNKSGLYKLIKYNDIPGVKFLLKSRENIEHTNENISREKRYKLVEKICENKQLEIIKMITNTCGFSTFNNIFNTFHVATIKGYLELAYWIAKELGKNTNPDWMEKICDSVTMKKVKFLNTIYNENFQTFYPEKINSEKDIITYKFTINGWPENIWIVGDYFNGSKNYMKYINKIYILGDGGLILHFWPGDYLLSCYLEKNNTINLPIFPWIISAEIIVVMVEVKLPNNFLQKVSNPFQLKIPKIHTVYNSYELYEKNRKKNISPDLYPIYIMSDFTDKFNGEKYLSYKFDWSIGPNIITEIIFMKPWPEIIRFRFMDFPLDSGDDRINNVKLIRKNDSLLFPVIIFPNCRYIMNLEYPDNIVKGNIYVKFLNCLISRENHIFSRRFVTS